MFSIESGSTSWKKLLFIKLLLRFSFPVRLLRSLYFFRVRLLPCEGICNLASFSFNLFSSLCESYFVGLIVCERLVVKFKVEEGSGLLTGVGIFGLDAWLGALCFGRKLVDELIARSPACVEPVLLTKLCFAMVCDMFSRTYLARRILLFDLGAGASLLLSSHCELGRR